MLEAEEQGLVQQIIRIRSLKDSNEAVLQGLASGDVVLVDGMVIAQAKIASSVPLGETIPRLAAPSDQVRQLRPTRNPRSSCLGSRPGTCASLIVESTRKRRPFAI